MKYLSFINLACFLTVLFLLWYEPLIGFMGMFILGVIHVLEALILGFQNRFHFQPLKSHLIIYGIAVPLLIITIIIHLSEHDPIFHEPILTFYLLTATSLILGGYWTFITFLMGRKASVNK